VFLAEQLSAAVKTAQPKDTRAQKLIGELKDWNGIADANSPIVSFLHATRRAALDIILEPYLGVDTDLYEWRSMAFLQKVLTERPEKWLPSEYKSYDALLAAAADRAAKKLAAESGSQHTGNWSWKRFNSLQMLHPIGRSGILKFLLSISDKPQSGTVYSVRAASKRHGPSMRFVANPVNWDQSIMVITTGESGQLGSEHYADQFSYWYEGKEILSPFGETAEKAARKHALTLEPAN
jgi:penicillin amidase